jgi:hypothetical protein
MVLSTQHSITTEIPQYSLTSISSINAKIQNRKISRKCTSRVLSHEVGRYKKKTGVYMLEISSPGGGRGNVSQCHLGEKKILKGEEQMGENVREKGRKGKEKEDRGNKKEKEDRKKESRLDAK